MLLSERVIQQEVSHLWFKNRYVSDEAAFLLQDQFNNKNRNWCKDNGNEKSSNSSRRPRRREELTLGFVWRTTISVPTRIIHHKRVDNKELEEEQTASSSSSREKDSNYDEDDETLFSAKKWAMKLSNTCLFFSFADSLPVFVVDFMESFLPWGFFFMQFIFCCCLETGRVHNTLIVMFDVHMLMTSCSFRRCKPFNLRLLSCPSLRNTI